jgi:manganese/zinc/iron transport system substrate-binding protein
MLMLGTLWGMALIVPLGCKQEVKPSKLIYQGRYPIKVVCTTGMVADLVRTVGGTHVKVEHQLMGPGVDPHTYKPISADARKLEEADMIFYSGLNLEGKMSDLFVKMSRKKPTIPVTGSLKDEQIKNDDAEEHYDPHVWFDVSLWSQAANAVRDALIEFDPKHTKEYQDQAKTYQSRLVRLNEYVVGEIAKIPEKNRVLVTAHDAFRYFGTAYGVTVKAVQGISTEAEASIKDRERLVQFLVNGKYRAVFLESSVAPENIQALVDDCKAQGHTIVIGGTLFSDAMGKEGTPTGTYEGMIKHNVDTIVNALK